MNVARRKEKHVRKRRKCWGNSRREENGGTSVKTVAIG